MTTEIKNKINKPFEWKVGKQGITRNAEGNIIEQLSVPGPEGAFGMVWDGGVIAHSIVARHTPESGYTHCEEDWINICDMVEAQMIAGEWECGYAEGIYLVKLYTGEYLPGHLHGKSNTTMAFGACPRQDDFIADKTIPVWCPVVDLTGAMEIFPDLKLIAKFEPRIKGEEPRKTITVDCNPKRSKPNKQRAKAAWAIVYHSDVLKKNGQNEGENKYEIVSINSSVDGRFEPMHPDTMMHNQFGSDGGSDIQMDPEDFMEQLERSFKYWKNKVMIEGGQSPY